jgi:hypothetical protein
MGTGAATIKMKENPKGKTKEKSEESPWPKPKPQSQSVHYSKDGLRRCWQCPQRGYERFEDHQHRNWS